MYSKNVHALFIQKWKLENSVVAHGNDGAMEVCLVHITTFTNRPDFLLFSLGKQCCAVDYISHAVDSATALLNFYRISWALSLTSPLSGMYFCTLSSFHHLWIISTSWSWTNPLFMPFFCLDSSWIFWSNRRMAIMLEVVKFILGPPPSRSARDEHRRSNEAITGTTTSMWFRSS